MFHVSCRITSLENENENEPTDFYGKKAEGGSGSEESETTRRRIESSEVGELKPNYEQRSRITRTRGQP